MQKIILEVGSEDEAKFFWKTEELCTLSLIGRSGDYKGSWQRSEENNSITSSCKATEEKKKKGS
jgi:hypothetical protein